MKKIHKSNALRFWVMMWCKVHLCNFLLSPLKEDLPKHVRLPQPQQLTKMSIREKMVVGGSMCGGSLVLKVFLANIEAR